jgi:DNA (cytosine-5)-methyltransferase 1
MPIKNSYITVTDQFCGAGGSSQGATAAGAEVIMALNHWKLAIETHNTNFPNTNHDCTDISACQPRRYPSTDILITSPECTKHTNADGKKKPQKQLNAFEKIIFDPADERSRATMWDVPRFAEYHKYNYIIVENVVEVSKWLLFDSWLRVMHALGYNHKIVFHNSMFSWPTPQSRDRIYIHFWRKGNKAPNLEFTPLAYCSCCEKNIYAVQAWKKPTHKFGVYGKRGQYLYKCPHDGTVVDPYYYAAFNVIDWSDLGEPVLNRKRGPLCTNTIRRITTGIDKFWNMPFMVKLEHSKNDNVRDLGQALYAQTTCDGMGFITPLIVEMNGTGTARPSTDPLCTATTAYNKHGLLWPFIVENKGMSNARSSNSALSTQTTERNHGIVTDSQFQAFLSYYNSKGDQNTHFTEPISTLPTSDRAFITSFRKPTLEDCFYRSLKAHEVKLGMGFHKDYVVLGNSKDQVKQCGNAVTPPAMKWQIERAIETFK